MLSVKFNCICGSVLGVLWLFASTPARAIIFEPIYQNRGVEINAQINAFNFVTQESASAIFNDANHSLPDGWDPLRLGMSLELPESNCFGEGVATQKLTAGSGRIEFSGLADININGMPSYPYMVEGTGAVMVKSEYKFRVTTPQEIELFMNSSIGDYRDDDFKFSLISNNSDLPVWTATAVLNEFGEESRSFSRRLVLQQGEYTILTQLEAFSSLSGTSVFAGRTWAEFTITAVPEPSAFVLAFTGGVLMLLFLPSVADVRRRRPVCDELSSSRRTLI